MNWRNASFFGAVTFRYVNPLLDAMKANDNKMEKAMIETMTADDKETEETLQRMIKNHDDLVQWYQNKYPNG